MCVCGVLVQLLSDCHALYCEQRLALLAGVVQDRLLQYGADQTIAAMTRSGCSYLIQVCEQERELFQHFFPSDAGDAALAPLLDPLCTVLYDLLRPAVVELTGIEPLCDLADILQVWARPPSVCCRSTALEHGSHIHTHRVPTTPHASTRQTHLHADQCQLGTPCQHTVPTRTVEFIFGSDSLAGATATAACPQLSLAASGFSHVRSVWVGHARTRSPPPLEWSAG